MKIKNFEFKAQVADIEEYESKLRGLNPRFAGTDHQIDTYFKTTIGRLKLREGTIENALIQYNRENKQGAKQSDILLYKHAASKVLKEILTQQFGILAVVDKIRKIYFIENVKFHFDHVKGLGTFLEVEAIDDSEQFTIEELQYQCDKYFSIFDLHQTQLVAKSYSDLILE